MSRSATHMVRLLTKLGSVVIDVKHSDVQVLIHAVNGVVSDNPQCHVRCFLVINRRFQSYLSTWAETKGLYF